MKAIDYYEKYKNNEFDHKGVSDYIIEMSKEAKELMTARKCKTNSAVISVIKEINDKSNAVMRLFEKNGIPQPLNDNAIIEYRKREMPEIAKYL